MILDRDEEKARDAGKLHYHYCGIIGHQAVCRDLNCKMPIKSDSCIYCVRRDMEAVGIITGDAYTA